VRGCHSVHAETVAGSAGYRQSRDETAQGYLGPIADALWLCVAKWWGQVA